LQDCWVSLAVLGCPQYCFSYRLNMP
jgi:hypothetical protein